MIWEYSYDAIDFKCIVDLEDILLGWPPFTIYTPDIVMRPIFGC